MFKRDYQFSMEYYEKGHFTTFQSIQNEISQMKIVQLLSNFQTVVIVILPTIVSIGFGKK